MTASYKNYIVRPQDPCGTRDKSPDAMLAWTRATLDSLVSSITGSVLPVHGGEILNDGSQISYLVVSATEAGKTAIENLAQGYTLLVHEYHMPTVRPPPWALIREDDNPTSLRPGMSPLRRALNEALNNIIHLEQGLALAVAPLDDPDQLKELQKAKTSILEALDLARTAPASRFSAVPEIGDVERDGDHKGEIYGGLWPKEYGGDDKPIWFSAARKLMDHYAAAAWASEQGGSLPTRKQGDYLDTVNGKGAFKDLFNLTGSFPAGFVWLAEPDTDSLKAWCQSLGDGDQGTYYRGDHELPVLCVRR